MTSGRGTEDNNNEKDSMSPKYSPCTVSKTYGFYYYFS